MLSGDIDLIEGRMGPFYTLLEEFSQYFATVTIICTSFPREAKIFPFPNVSVFSFGTGIRALVKSYSKITNLFVGGPVPEIVISHDFGLFRNGALAWALHLKFDIPFISEILHVDGHPIAVNFREKFQYFITKLYIKWAKHWITGFRIINGNEIKHFLLRLGVPPQKLILSYAFFIDSTVFTPKQNSEKKYDVMFWAIWDYPILARQH